MLSFDLSKDLYDKEAILETAHSYTNQCSVEVVDVGGWRLVIKPIDEKAILPPIFKDEFINRLIDQQMRLRMDKEFVAIRNAISLR